MGFYDMLSQGTIKLGAIHTKL